MPAQPEDTAKFTLRIPYDLLDYVEERAVENDRSRNWVIVDIIRRAKDGR